MNGFPQRSLDAKTFQQPLDELTDTIAFKIQREGSKHIPKPEFAVHDIYYLLRQSHGTYNLFCYINADERRGKDPWYRPAYSAVILPLVRTMIDCLYNITTILENPGPNAFLFRESGIKTMLQALDDDQARYGGDPTWDDWIARRRQQLHEAMKRDGITPENVTSASIWPTLSGYLRAKTANPDHQQFLRKLTFGFWQEYSGISHATFQGLLPIGTFLAPNDLPHELRPNVESNTDILVSIHIARAAAVLLCTITEIQCEFLFQSANINARLHRIWGALRTVPEIDELYVERYEKLMANQGVVP